MKTWTTYWYWDVLGHFQVGWGSLEEQLGWIITAGWWLGSKIYPANSSDFCYVAAFICFYHLLYPFHQIRPLQTCGTFFPPDLKEDPHLPTIEPFSVQLTHVQRISGGEAGVALRSLDSKTSKLRRSEGVGLSTSPGRCHWRWGLRSAGVRCGQLWNLQMAMIFCSVEN